MTWQENMVTDLNSSMGPPFLPEGFAEAEILYDGEYSQLHLRIGDRDVDYDLNGKRTGSGTNVGEAVQWQITKIREKLDE